MRIPLLPTVFVVASVAAMIGLGVWQLQRKGEKEALLAEYAAASEQAAVAWPAVPEPEALPLFRRSSVNCLAVAGWQAVSGKSRDGKSGIAHLAECRTGGGEGPGALVALGWSNNPESPQWQGGIVNGIIAPDKDRLVRLVATDEVPGLERLAPPSADSIPNNHLLYAIQWFFFALAAAVIYVLALRGRQKKRGQIAP